MKKIIKYLKWIVMIIASLFLLTEVFLRITYQKKLARWHAMEYVPDTIIGYRYKPNSTFLNSNVAYSNICKVNKYGFPGDDFNIKKANGCYRIIVVGTSDDTGFTSDGTESYVRRLNTKFKQGGYKKVEVINCSIDGDDLILRDIQLIRNEIFNYNPDIILLRNQFPLKDILRYRETYKGHIIKGTKLSDIDSTKKYIDIVYAGNNTIFKMYDISYIFRYYAKIYFDYKKDRPKHWFVNFSEKIFTYESLKKLNMYVRKEVRYTPTQQKKAFDIFMYESDPNWNEKAVSWNNYSQNNKLIRTFSSGIQTNTWVDIDISEYLKEKIKKNDKDVSLLFFISPSRLRRIIFASKEFVAPNSVGGVHPMLQITGQIKNANQTSLPIFTLKPTDDGYIRGGDYSDKNHEASDSTIQVKNGYDDQSYSRKGLVKFDISNVQSIEKATLKLFVTKIEFGDDMVPGTKVYSIKESLDTLQSLMSFLDEKNIQLILFDTYESKRDPIISFYNKNKINYLPLNVSFKMEYNFGTVDGHSTQKGHEAIANAFYEAFVNQIFPKLNNPNLLPVKNGISQLENK